MPLFLRHQFEDDEDEAGVHLSALGISLVTWAAMQDRSPATVAEAAMAFNTTPAVIREAIDDACWILVVNPREVDPTKQRIEVDGE